MKKESFADKLARKSFESSAVQDSWKSHLEMFGPILEPAFEDDYQARIHLTNALNAISRRQVNKALPLLQKLGAQARTDADKAAVLYFTGLACEFGGQADDAMELYMEANAYEHKLYLPYLKVAKSAYADGDYGPAEENFHKTIECIPRTGAQNLALLASVHANLASCLIMMHRFEEAKKELETSKTLQPEMPNRVAIEATLYAAMGEADKARERLELLAGKDPRMAETVKAVVEKTLAGQNPQYASVELEKAAVNSFWRWFALNEERLYGMLKREEYPPMVDEIISVLKPMFAFSEHELQMSIGKSETGYVLVFIDFYSTALHDGYTQLINACPEEIPEHWGFDLVH